MIKKKYVLKNKQRFMVFIMAASFLLCVTVLSIFSIFNGVNALDCQQSKLKTVYVFKGDTLWSIAKQYNTKMDIREYIYEVKKLNNMETSELYAGQEIILP